MTGSREMAGLLQPGAVQEVGVELAVAVLAVVGGVVQERVLPAGAGAVEPGVLVAHAPEGDAAALLLGHELQVLVEDENDGLALVGLVLFDVQFGD